PGTILATVAILIGVWLLFVLKALVLIVLTAIVIASAVEPGIRWFLDRGFHRNMAVTLIYATVLALFFAPLYFFVPPLLDEAVSFISTMARYLEGFNVEALLSSELLASTKEVVNAGSLTNIVLEFRQFFTSASGGAFHALASIFGGVFSTFLVVILSVYFAVNETGIDDFLRIVVPPKYESYAVSLWRRSQAKIGLWMQGQLVLSLIMGVLAYLWLAILQVPYAFLIAVFAAVIEVVPIFGSFLSGTIAVVVAWTAGGPTLAVLVLGGFVIINQLQSHLVYPLVVKRIVGVPPLLVVLSLIVGSQLAGFYGILLSVPAAATLKEFVSDIQARRQKEPEPDG
ncbi:MAG: AI-2E family transporter, partial [Patescibacteria group bacterium]